MNVKFIEASHGDSGNHGKFMLARFDADEWSYQSALPGYPARLLSGRGWGPNHLLFLDLQTGEGVILSPTGLAGADLAKHRVWVCPLAEPFLEWLYAQDTSDLNALPAYVALPDAPFAMYGYRRSGGNPS